MTAGTTMLGSTLPEVSFGFDAGGDGASWRVLQLRAKEGLSEQIGRAHV